MSNRAIIYISLFLFCSNCFSSDQYKTNQNRNMMQLMIQIEAYVNEGNEFATIQNLLDDYKSSVNYEQISHDHLYQGQKGECDSEIKFRQAEVSDADNLLSGNNAQLIRQIALKNKLQSEHTVMIDQIKQFQQFSDLIKQFQDCEEQNFNKATDVFSQALNQVEDYYNLSVDMLMDQQNSFKQLSEQSSQMIQQAILIGKSGFYTKILFQIADLANNQQKDDSNIELLADSVDNLRFLKKNLKEQQIIEEQKVQLNEGNQTISLYQQQLDRFIQTIQRLENSSQALNQQIINLENQIAEQIKCFQNTQFQKTEKIQQIQTKRSRNQKLLDDATSLCETFQNEYLQVSEARKQELNIISEVEKIAFKRIQKD